jgi:hypothetical protein
MADKHGAAPADDCKSRVTLTTASGIFAATAHVAENDHFGHDPAQVLGGTFGGQQSKRSGKSCIVTRRLACNPGLQNALYHWARVAVRHDPRSRAKYAALRLRGRGHARALRSVGDRLLNRLRDASQPHPI